MKKVNYLYKKPIIKEGLSWHRDLEGIVTLKVDNVGMFNKILKVLFKKSEISYIHLDETGSYVWMQLNGKNNVYEIGKKLAEKYGDKEKPLYAGLMKYFKILESYKFIEWAN